MIDNDKELQNLNEQKKVLEEITKLEDTVDFQIQPTEAEIKQKFVKAGDRAWWVSGHGRA